MAFSHDITGNPLILLVTIASSCGFLLFGYDNGVFSGIIVSPWFLATFHNPDSKYLATISAMYNIGGFIGSSIAFFIGARLGRRRTTMAGITICTIGAVVQAVSQDIGELIAGRIICGTGVGIMTSTVGIWQAEVTPARSRGAYLTMQLLGGTATGLFLAQWINYGFHATTTRVAFVFPVAFQLVFLLVVAVLLPILPESPRWLARQGLRDEARAVLERLSNTDVDTRLAQINEAVQLEEHSSQNQYGALFTLGPTQNLRRLGLACGTMIMHQLGGINSVTYYMPTLLQTFIGASHVESLWVAGLSSLTSMIFALVPVLTIDRLGRRVFLWGGAIWQTVIFIIIAVLLAEAESHPAESHTLGVVAIVMVFLFYGGNAMTWLGPSWAYPTEILPLQIREKGLALGNICYWLFQFMIVEITPIALTNIKYRFYVILAVFNVFNFVIVFFFFPETKGLSLEEIDFQFAEKYGFEVPNRSNLGQHDEKGAEVEAVEHA
ncbi:sugar transporter STL1 [Xylariales sp. PMI_506]|nr:sugar transporter STL1 [Xylariales sp. PMI_506]